MEARTEGPADLPDYYETVAQDVTDYCGSSGGRVWVDLGSGPGGLGLALLEKTPEGTMVMMDPNAEARSPETFRRLAKEAGLPSFEVLGEGGLGADDPNTGIGIWVRFTKEAENGG